MFDQYISYYLPDIEATVHFYDRLIFHLFEVAMNNAFTVYSLLFDN